MNNNYPVGYREDLNINTGGYEITHNSENDVIIVSKGNKSVEINLNNNTIWYKEDGLTNIYVEF